MKRSKDRLLYIDILNILAIISVVAMHCNEIVHLSPNVRAFNSSLIVDVLCYFAVPVFFMITGANLMNYREKYDTKTFIKKRCIKIIIPLIAWSIIMLVWKINTNQIVITDHSIVNYINLIINNGAEGTYYFMFYILGVYLTIPLLSHLTKDEYRKSLWYICIVYFIINAFLHNILPLFNIHLFNGLKIPFGEYIIYVILGYLLSTESLEKKKKYLLIVATIVGLLYHYLTRYYLSKADGVSNTSTAGYYSWHAILQACLVFVIVKDLKIIDRIKKNDKVCKVLQIISGCSFGIYLSHFIIKYYVVNIFNLDIYSWFFRTVGIFIVYFISLLIVYIIKKIPIIRKIVP